MLLVVGLGNPGEEYRGTRHNLGFRVVERLAELGRGTEWKRTCQSLTARVRYAGRDLVPAMPQTYMNRSGGAVECLLREYGSTRRELLVVCDDVNLPLGSLRLKPRGGDGGHNGLADIIERIGPDFGRLRIGCGPAPRYADLAEFVLAPFSTEEAVRLPEIIERAVKGAALLDRMGYQKAMAELNRRPLLDTEADGDGEGEVDGEPEG